VRDDRGACLVAAPACGAGGSQLTAATVILWGHALAALLFAVLALSQCRDGALSMSRAAFVLA